MKAKVQCELNITTQLQEGGVAFRHCTPNGTWDFIHSSNKTWANYSDCFLQPDISTGKQEFFESIYILYTVGYSISFGSLAVAILIIGYFRRLHCTRNYIHLHLFVSFMLRAVSIFVKDRVAQAHLGIEALQSLVMQGDLQNFIGGPSVDKSQYLNFILFLNTVRVLATKIWETNAVGHDMRKQYRKLAKSTLVLVLVFGVHYIIFICQPHSFSGLWWEIRMHCELFFNSFQGFFVSIVYCYCNGEVQAEMKKMWTRWNLSIDWKRTPPCGGQRYGSVLTTVTHSTTSQSQMGASTRLVLISSKPTKNASRQIDSHVTLPGYVWSSSEQDCQPHSTPEETKERHGRQGDDIPTGASSRPVAFTLDSEGCKGQTERI
ncbi:Parathyroid hormone 2 receptor [Cricetulus griseus]|uniref:Parathyroid hormone 2 receptor n=1 Tax=Cricetulus griseus TaxID=10029 RepID=G3H4X8_CRIGR|nr:Parathyroid hormone 2 receptor [Cricetulus griseus]